MTLVDELRARKIERRGFEVDNLRTIPPVYGRGAYVDYLPDPLCQKAADEIERLLAILSDKPMTATEVMRSRPLLYPAMSDIVAREMVGALLGVEDITKEDYRHLIAKWMPRIQAMINAALTDKTQT